MNVTLQVQDGLSGLQRCYAYISPPVGSTANQISCSTPINTATQFMSGSTSCLLNVPRFATAGNWTWDYIFCLDFANNYRYIYASDLPAYGFPLVAFVQTGLADTLPPTLLVFSFTPSVVNTTSASASITFVLNVSDDISGPSRCEVTILLPD